MAQGAVLSPTLFSIYINDIPLNIINKESWSLLFADDLVYLKNIKLINQENENNINKHLSEIYKWNCNWRLKMAPEKCSYLLFSKNKKTAHLEQLALKIRNETIQNDSKKGLKFLVITFDKYLSFDKIT